MTGHDGLAPMRTERNTLCGHCGAPGICVRYMNTELLVSVLNERFISIRTAPSLILQDPAGLLGVECGCYARFQRQVAYATRRA